VAIAREAPAGGLTGKGALYFLYATQKRSHSVRLCCAVGLAFIGVLAAVSAARAQDTGQLRGYLQARVGLFSLTDPSFITNGVDADHVQDAYGVSVGVNLNRYVGVEIAGDMYELAINFTGGNVAGLSGSLSEYKVWTLVPQVQLRYPLLHGRLIPSILGGVGVSFSQLNDRKPPAFGITLSGSNTALAATIGTGIEYFLLNNLAMGIEARYVYAGEHPLQVGTLSGTANPSALLTTLGFRLLWPEATTADRPAAPASPPVPDRIRGYFQARFGGAFFPNQDLIGNVQTDTAQIGYGMSLGVDLNRYFSVEVAADTTEADVTFAGQGKFGEYGLWSVIPQLRVRYVLQGSRLVSYVVGGVGILWTEFRDITPRVHGVAISAKGMSVVGSIGAGFESFIATNLALGLDVKYLIFGGQQFTIQGQVLGTVHPNPLYTSLGIQILFP
jgi:opacity protein-like surface antigen